MSWEEILAYEATHTSQDTKKKGVALKSKVKLLEDDFNDSFSDEEIIFFTKRLRRLMRSKSKNKGSSSKEQKENLSKVICHHCKEARHFKFNYPKLKREDKTKK